MRRFAWQPSPTKGRGTSRLASAPMQCETQPSPLRGRGRATRNVSTSVVRVRGRSRARRYSLIKQGISGDFPPFRSVMAGRLALVWCRRKALRASVRILHGRGVRFCRKLPANSLLVAGLAEGETGKHKAHRGLARTNARVICRENKKLPANSLQSREFRPKRGRVHAEVRSGGEAALSNCPRSSFRSLFGARLVHRSAHSECGSAPGQASNNREKSPPAQASPLLRISA
jgi:hypothetical protein